MKKCLSLLLAMLLIGTVAFALPQWDWVEISDADGLRAIADKPDGHYRLINDIDLSGIDWKPIPFSGTLDGACHAILNMNVTQPGDTHYETHDGNHKVYSTVGAGLFDCAIGATVRNLAILGANIDVTTDENCFCGILVGGANELSVANCRFEGRVWLHQSAINSGVGGMGGYVTGSCCYDCAIRSELVIVDTNTKDDMEEFGGGVIGCGFMDMDANVIETDIYSSVHGYCHNGGIIGMFARGASKSAKSEVSNNEVTCRITFFEDVHSRRAYAAYDFGEEVSGGLEHSNNTKVAFAVRESEHCDVNLYPCTCAVTEQIEVIAPTDSEYGYTLHTCPSCGRTCKDSYLPK